MKHTKEGPCKFAVANNEQVFDTGEMVFPAELAEHVRRVAPVLLAGEQVLDVPEVFHSLLPGGGIQRGWTTRVDGCASSRALAWALLGEITTGGRWVAAVNVEGISLAAAAELGVAVERVLMVQNVTPDVWAATIGALIGAVDVVVFGEPQHRVRPSEYRQMASRCRERGTVLMELAPDPSTRVGRSGLVGQLQYDLSFQVDPMQWDGLGRGHGYLQARRVRVAVSGRRAPGQGRHGHFALPGDDGTLQQLTPEVDQRPLLAAVK